MTKRIIAITFIFVCTSIAWVILGATIFSRTYDSGSVSNDRVASTWGAAQNQGPPTASFTTKTEKQEQSFENGVKVMKKVTEESDTEVPLESSRIDVALDLQHRQKGLLWYSTYKVAFSGIYDFRNPSDKEQTVDFELHFPTSQAIYDNLMFVVDGNPIAIRNEGNSAVGSVKVAGGKTAQLTVVTVRRA